MSEVVKFEVGECYYTRSICNHDCIFAFCVIKRTEKTVKLVNCSGEVCSKRVKVCDGIEEVSLGNYSMAPILDAKAVLPGEGSNVAERRELLQRQDRIEEEEGRLAIFASRGIAKIFEQA